MKPATDYCRILGNIAFARGIGRAVCNDRIFLENMGHREIGDPRTITEMTAWYAGWDEANLANGS